MSEEMLEHLYETAFEDSSVQSNAIKTYIDELRQESKELKAIINYFINGYEKDKNAKEVTIKHVCKYTMMINEFQQWLEKEKEILYRDYGYTQQAMTKCYDKLIEIRGKYEK